MGQVAEQGGSAGPQWPLRALYAILIVSGVALVTLLLGDLIAAMEANTGGELHDVLIFDLAWPIFLIGSVVTLVGGLGALIVSWPRRSRGLTRYAVWALAYSVIAVVVAFWVGGFEL